MVGGFHENSISRKILSSTIPFYQDDLTWCVPPADLASNLTNAFGIFNWITWLVTLFILLATGWIFLAYSRYEMHQNNENIVWSVLMSLSFTIGNPSHYFPQRVLPQIFLLFVLFYGTHFNVFYHSFLITVMTRPKYEPQVANMYMAVHQGFRFYGNEDTLAHFQSKQNDTTSISIVNNFITCLDLEKCLLYIKNDKKVAIAVSRHHADNNEVIPRSQMYCFAKKDNIYTYSVSMLTKKQYHLLDKVNSIVRTISESGLLHKWESESSNAAEEESSADANSEGPHGNAIKLKIEHVQAGFLLLGIGSILGAIILLLEIAFHKFKMKNCKKKENKNFKNIYAHIEKLLC